jgi:chromosome segregation ATPase
MVTVNTVCTDAVHDISRTLREMNTVQQNNTGVTDEIKKIRVDRVVIENLLDMVDEIAAHFHHDQVDLSMIRSDLRGQLGRAKAALRKLVAEYQEKMGTFLKITNHRRRRAKRTGTTRRDFDEDNTSDTGESASGEDDYVSATDIPDEDEQQPTRTTQGVHPDVADILREALRGTEEIQRNARAFIADVEEMSNVVRDIRQEIDDTTAERKGLARKAAENGRESPQLAERIRENQKHIEDLNRELLQEREMRANFEKQARSLEAEAQEIIKEMEHIEQDHSTQHKENETKIAERVSREVKQIIQKMHDEMEQEGSDSSDAGDDRRSRRSSNARTYRASAEESEDPHDRHSSDAGNDRRSRRNSPTRSSRASSEEREDLHDMAPTKIETLLEQTEDVGAEAVEVVEEAAAIGHHIADLQANIDETTDQLIHLRETERENPNNTGLTQIINVTEARIENLEADLEYAQEALDKKQDQIIEIHHEAALLQEKASKIQTTGNTGGTASQEKMQEIKLNITETLARTRPKPSTPMPERRHTRTGR